MDRLVCPHCKTRRIAAARAPKNMVQVMPCPACQELVVFFRRKVIALDRKKLEQGTRQERKMHIASIIAEFIEPGMLNFNIPATFISDEEPEVDEEDFLESEEDLESPPISDREMREFTRVQLRRLDNPEYFRRNLGEKS